MEDIELLPCPFCGSYANFVNTTDGGVAVECVKCLSSSKLVYPSKEDPKRILAESWNSRSDYAASIGARWMHDSSLREWFPVTYDELEQLRVQLAGCGVVARDGDSSLISSKGCYGWSASYQDVRELRMRHDALIREIIATCKHWRAVANDKKDASIDNCAYVLEQIVSGKR